MYDPTPLVRVLAGLLRPKSKTKQGLNHSQEFDDQINRSNGIRQSGDVSEDENRSDGESVTRPVAYLAQAIRSLRTLEIYLSMLAQAGLQLIDITESMSFPQCLPELVGFDRNQVRVHKVFYP